MASREPDGLEGEATVRVTVRLSEEEHAGLEEMARRELRSASVMVRVLVRRAMRRPLSPCA